MSYNKEIPKFPSLFPNTIPSFSVPDGKTNKHIKRLFLPYVPTSALDRVSLDVILVSLSNASLVILLRFSVPLFVFHSLPHLVFFIYFRTFKWQRSMIDNKRWGIGRIKRQEGSVKLGVQKRSRRVEGKEGWKGRTQWQIV